MLDSLLVGVMFFTSYSVRTANVQPNPDDYEVSLGFDHKNFHINRQWERELGISYHDDLIWFKIDNQLYFKPEYMNKESKSVKYIKMDWRKSWSSVNLGFTTRSTDDDLDKYETFASLGFLQKKTYSDKLDVEFSFDGYLPPDAKISSGARFLELKNFEYETKFKMNFKLSERVRFYNIGELTKLQGNEFYKAKLGVEVAI